jgi:hypothetical protein
MTQTLIRRGGDPLLTYLGGETLTPGGVSTAATIPAGTNFVLLDAELGDGYYELNDTPASASSPGYLPEGGQRCLFGIENLESLAVFAEDLTKIHLQYYQA